MKRLSGSGTKPLAPGRRRTTKLQGCGRRPPRQPPTLPGCERRRSTSARTLGDCGRKWSSCRRLPNERLANSVKRPNGSETKLLASGQMPSTTLRLCGRKPSRRGRSRCRPCRQPRRSSSSLWSYGRRQNGSSNLLVNLWLPSVTRPVRNTPQWTATKRWLPRLGTRKPPDCSNLGPDRRGRPDGPDRIVALSGEQDCQRRPCRARRIE